MPQPFLMKVPKYLTACLFLSIFNFPLKVNIFSCKYLFLEETSVFGDSAEKRTQQVVVPMANSFFLQNKSICSAEHSFWVWVFFCLKFPPAGFCIVVEDCYVRHSPDLVPFCLFCSFFLSQLKAASF